MVGRRPCRLCSFPLALLLSLLNTLIIIVYLGPQHLKNSDTFLPRTALPQIKTKAKMEPDATSVLKSQNIPSAIPVAYIADDQSNHAEHMPKISQNLTPVVNQPTSKKDIQLTRTFNHNPVFNIEHESLDHAYQKLKLDQKSMLMIGKPPSNPVQIVIGIPTVKRSTTNYLSSTLKQLVDYLRNDEKRQCHIVVFSADLDPSGNQKTADLVNQQFKNEVNSGLIEVIKPDRAFYSKLTDLPLLWKDKPDRVKWRSKQCLDYALLFAYSRNLGKYYLQLEDDLLVSPNYFNQINYFIQVQGLSKWSNLQFGTRGFIGMLFRGSDLGRLALFVKMYYWIFPVDILFRHFNDIHLYGNSAHDVYSPPLFRHVGAESSLKGQTRKLEDITQNTKYINKRQYKDANNPQCLISTSIEVFNGNTIDGPYRSTNIGFFWGKNVQISDFVLIEFLKELILLHVVVETGSKFAPQDLIGEGKLETSGVGQDGGCDKKNFAPLKSRQIKGKIESAEEKFGGTSGVKCICLTVTKLNKNEKGTSRWLVIREIAVWSQ